jgi:hypothetical protein
MYQILTAPQYAFAQLNFTIIRAGWDRLGLFGAAAVILQYAKYATNRYRITTLAQEFVPLSLSITILLH